MLDITEKVLVCIGCNRQIKYLIKTNHHYITPLTPQPSSKIIIISKEIHQSGRVNVFILSLKTYSVHSSYYQLN